MFKIVLCLLQDLTCITWLPLEVKGFPQESNTKFPIFFLSLQVFVVEVVSSLQIFLKIAASFK